MTQQFYDRGKSNGKHPNNDTDEDTEWLNPDDAWYPIRCTVHYDNDNDNDTDTSDSNVGINAKATANEDTVECLYIQYHYTSASYRLMITDNVHVWIHNASTSADIENERKLYAANMKRSSTIDYLMLLKDLLTNKQQEAEAEGSSTSHTCIITNDTTTSSTTLTLTSTTLLSFYEFHWEFQCHEYGTHIEQSIYLKYHMILPLLLSYENTIASNADADAETKKSDATVITYNKQYNTNNQVFQNSAYKSFYHAVIEYTRKRHRDDDSSSSISSSTVNGSEKIRDLSETKADDVMNETTTEAEAESRNHVDAVVDEEDHGLLRRNPKGKLKSKAKPTLHGADATRSNDATTTNHDKDSDATSTVPSTSANLDTGHNEEAASTSDKSTTPTSTSASAYVESEAEKERREQLQRKLEQEKLQKKKKKKLV
jgi:hypothetical protein